MQEKPIEKSKCLKCGKPVRVGNVKEVCMCPEGVGDKWEEVEKLAEKMHSWYLEAIKELDPDRTYEELTEGQKFIDRYIAREVFNFLQTTRREAIEMCERDKEQAVWEATSKMQ